ncbi:MAG: spermine/spermidine synthase [Bacillota bacterium]
MILARENTKNGEIVLRQGSAGYEIIVDGQFLMSSASGRSSEVLVELGLGELAGRNNLSVLIAGLGLGFSLKTALEYAAVAEVTVVELEEKIIQWHQGDIIPGSAVYFKDARVQVHSRDFLEFVAGCREHYDLIAIDIDNGPDWLSHPENSRLYGRDNLGRIKEILKPGGITTFWSASPALELAERLESVFGNVSETEVADHNGEGRIIPAFIYLCRS